MTTQKLCIYHANCNDGFGAALAVYSSAQWGSKTEFYPAHYNPPARILASRSSRSH